MIVYLAGTSVSDPKKQKKLQQLFKQGSKLHSYYHLFNLEKKWFKMNRKNKVNLFLDSGAFSAFTQGVEIDIYEYIQFIKKHINVLEVYANLDVISTGKTGDEESAKQTWFNQMKMEKAGLSPLPVFHYGEPIKYLKRYIDRYEYISLGGMVPISNPRLESWLDGIFTKHLTDSDKMPKVKVHGFGLTSLKLMLRYPWYSVDSTSWVVAGRMGSIYVPKYDRINKKWIYDKNSRKVSVSNRSPGLKDDKNHIKNMTPEHEKEVMMYLREKGYKLGKSEFKTVDEDHELADNEKWAQKKSEVTDGQRMLEIIKEPGIGNMYQLRDEMNIIFFQDLEENMPEWPQPFEKDSESEAKKFDLDFES